MCVAISFVVRLLNPNTENISILYCNTLLKPERIEEKGTNYTGKEYGAMLPLPHPQYGFFAYKKNCITF